MGMIRQLGSGLSVQGLVELVNGRRDFEPLMEDVPLPLQPEIVRPLHQMCELPFRLDVLPDAKVLRPCLQKRIHHLLAMCFFTMAEGKATFFPLVFFPLDNLLGWRTERIMSSAYDGLLVFSSTAI